MSFERHVTWMRRRRLDPNEASFSELLYSTPPTIMPKIAKMYTPMTVEDRRRRSKSIGFVVEMDSLGIWIKPKTVAMMLRLKMIIFVPFIIQKRSGRKSVWSFMTKKMIKMMMPPTRTKRPRKRPLEAERQSTFWEAEQKKDQKGWKSRKFGGAKMLKGLKRAKDRRVKMSQRVRRVRGGKV